MRLQKYINEEFFDDEIEIIQLLESKSQPALKEMKQNKTIFWRGLWSQTDVNYIIKNVRQDRTPKDMPPKVQKWIDNEFKKKFGWKPRSTGVFASASHIGAHWPRYMFFPMGKYTYLWSNVVDDLYLHFQEVEWFNDVEWKRDLSPEQEEESKKDIEIIVNSYTDKNIKKAGRREVMFNIPSKKYIAVHEKYREAITRYLKGEKLHP